MEKGTNLGQAYVQVMPSAEGIQGQLSEIFEKEGTSSGNMFSSMFGANLATKGLELAGKAAVKIAQVLADTINASIDQYADYEQLTGGVEKLFGESADIVMKYAENAYKTAGVSANSYMEQITSFSASLISSLDGDTARAAELGNKAIEDMSDNANTFGTDIQNIQNAYQGFAKQNYTMLDNLKLGYGGTKTEMQRLVQDAEKLDSSFTATRDVNNDLTLSFSDIVKAIHIVQTDMKITGTTAKEAAGTISGSAASTQAAWTNLQTAMADKNGKTKEAVKSWVDAVATSTEQRFGSMEAVLSNIPETIGSFASAAAAKINEAIAISTDYGKLWVESNNILVEHESLLVNHNAILQEGLTPLREAESYWTAFKGLIDENGTISAEHMTQADYLVQQINEQLGTQYTTQELINGLLSRESTALDEILKKKELEVELEANRQLMKDAQAELDEMNAQMATNQAEIDQFKELLELYKDAPSMVEYYSFKLEIAQQAQDELAKTAEIDTQILSQCWDNEAYAAAGAVEKIVTLDKDLIASADSVTQGKIDSLNQQIAKEEQHIKDLEAMRTTTNQDQINNQIAFEQTKLENLTSSRDAELAVLAEKNAQKQADEEQSNAIIHEKLDSFLNKYKTNLNDKMSGAVADFATNKASMESSANSLYDNVTGKVGDMAKDAKKATNFQWNLPSLKLPHFSASGGFNLNPLSVPKFGISWYSKAMEEAQVLNGATIFGSADGKLLGGGEVGSEVISGEDHLIELINDSVSSVLGPMVPAMMQIAKMLDVYLPEVANKETEVYLDGDVMVGKLAPRIDNELGAIGKLKARGM